MEVKRSSKYKTVIETTVDETKALDLAQRMLRAGVSKADVQQHLNKCHLHHVRVNDESQLVVNVILRESNLK